MKKPLIGITPQYDYDRNRVWIGPNYLDAIRAAGGVPILLPLNIDKDELAVVANACDGFLFSGGPDISPFRFGEETIKQCGVIVPERDLMEENLFSLTMETDKPILGICRGIQVLNVFLGGTIYQDISTQFKPKWQFPITTVDGAPGSLPNIQLSHSQESGNTVLTHSINVEEDSLLYDIVSKDTIFVNSFHHQAIKDLAPSLKLAATSPDSLIEAVYLPEKPFFLGVQWHPEHLFRTSDDAFNLFKAFINAC